MRFRVTFEGAIVDDDGSLMDPGALDSLLDQVMDELMKLSDGLDSDVGATLARGLVEVAVSVETDVNIQPEATMDALVRGGAIIRTALLAAQVATPGWSVEQLRITIESDRLPEAGPSATPTRELVDA